MASNRRGARTYGGRRAEIPRDCTNCLLTGQILVTTAFGASSLLASLLKALGHTATAEKPAATKFYLPDGAALIRPTNLGRL
ncbi:hypothetical protein KCP73_08495 [Salmonella enterica subsp. enterica]|nr:hypothetical protein KCP73_08495 [Salmonella enterica subsp. enterica]